MKTKKEVLKMSKKELEDYKWSDDLDKKDNNNCNYCYNCNKCNNCDNCDDCDNCYLCRNAKNLRYAICNVELGKEDYENKMS